MKKKYFVWLLAGDAVIQNASCCIIRAAAPAAACGVGLCLSAAPCLRPGGAPLALWGGWRARRAPALRWVGFRLGGIAASPPRAPRGVSALATLALKGCRSLTLARYALRAGN